MSKYAQRDDKKEKSHKRKNKKGKQAPRSSGNSTGGAENDGELTKPKQIFFRNMTYRQKLTWLLRYHSGFTWYEGQKAGESLYNPLFHDENKNQHPKPQGRAFNELTLAQKLTWFLHLGSALGDAIPPRLRGRELEAFLHKQNEQSTTQNPVPVNKHGSPTEKPPESSSTEKLPVCSPADKPTLLSGNTSASTPAQFLLPRETHVAPPLFPGFVNQQYHYSLTNQTHGAEPMPVMSSGLFLPGAEAAPARARIFPFKETQKQDEKVPEYSQLMKMNQKEYLSAMNKKHGTSINPTKRIRIRIFDGQERYVFITTMLENKDNQISKAFYGNYNNYPQALVDDLELYRTRNDIPQQTFTTQASPSVNLSSGDSIQKQQNDFLKVLEAYEETGGNLTEINQRSQRHELPDTAYDSWTTIKTITEAIRSEWSYSSASRNLTETFQLYERMMGGLSNQLDALIHTGTDAEMSHMRNSITMLGVEKNKQQALSEDVKPIVDYLANHTVTVSDDPRIAMSQALVLTYKIADPKNPARMLHKINFTDKEIIEDAQNKRNNRERDPEMASWLDVRQLEIYYIITKWKEWTGGRALSSISIDEFYQHASTKNISPLSAEQIFQHYEKSVASPAKDYSSVADLKGVSSFNTDAAFYKNINNYKQHDAKNEAADTLHYILDSAGLYPLDLDKPLKKFVCLNVFIPVFGLTYRDLRYVLKTFDRNLWDKAKGNLCLFQTDSDDYWILSTIQNMFYLKKITQQDFLRFSKPLSEERKVRELFGKIPELRSILPKPETKTKTKGIIATEERRYYKTRTTQAHGDTATTTLGDVLARMATRAFQGLAEMKKQFRFTERYKKPADYGTWSNARKIAWYVKNGIRNIGDFFQAVAKPLDMLVTWMDDEDYNPSEEDWAEMIFDVVTMFTTLGISAASAGAKVGKGVINTIKIARDQGLKGPALKKFVFTAIRPQLRKAAGGIGRELAGEVFPVIDWASFITSIGKWSYKNIRKLVPINMKNSADNNLSRKTFNLDDNIAAPGGSNSAAGHPPPKKPGYYRDSPVIAEGTAAKIYDTQDGYLIKEYKRELKDKPIEADSTGPIKADSTGPGKADSTGPGKADSTGPGKADSTGPIKADSTGPIKADSTGPGKADSTGPGKADSTEFVKGSSYIGALAEARRNCEALNRIYDPGTASYTITKGADPFVKIVYVKMKKIPGSSLSSILEKADDADISMVVNRLNTPDKLASEVNIMLDKLKVNGIQHYDINLGNVMYDPKLKQFHLIDFDRASITPKSGGKIAPLNDSQMMTMRNKLESDLNDFLRRGEQVERVSKAQRIFGQDASFHEIGVKTKIYKLTSHGFYGNTGHFSGVQTANNIETLLGEKPIIRLELESCFGGFGGKFSNAQIIANELTIPVKAYTGKVSNYSKQRNPNNYVLKVPRGNKVEQARMIAVNKLMFEIGEKFFSMRRAFNSLNRPRNRRDDVDTQLVNIAKTQDRTLPDDMWLTACFEEIMTTPGLLAQLGLSELGG